MIWMFVPIDGKAEIENEEKMTSPIQEIFEPDTPLVVQGNGVLAAHALVAGGISPPIAMVEPISGKPSAATVSPEEHLRAPDPTLKHEIAPNTPQMTIGTSGPSMGGPGR